MDCILYDVNFIQFKRTYVLFWKEEDKMDDLPGEEFDRGIKKWGGFFLSEHSEQIEREKQHFNWKEKMSEEHIEQILSDALLHQKVVIIQQKLVDDDLDPFPKKDVEGHIIGVENGEIWLKSEETRVKILFTDIHHISCRKHDAKWYM